MASHIAPIEERRNLGIGILLIAQVFFAVLDTSAKFMATEGLPLAEIVFVHYAVPCGARRRPVPAGAARPVP